MYTLSNVRSINHIWNQYLPASCCGYIGHTSPWIVSHFTFHRQCGCYIYTYVIPHVCVVGLGFIRCPPDKRLVYVSRFDSESHAIVLACCAFVSFRVSARLSGTYHIHVMSILYAMSWTRTCLAVLSSMRIFWCIQISEGFGYGESSHSWSMLRTTLEWWQLVPSGLAFVNEDTFAKRPSHLGFGRRSAGN